MALGDNIKRIRQLKKVSVRDLAEKIGVNVQSIYDWEKNAYEPVKENLESMAKVLGVPVKAFYDENGTDEYKAGDNNGKDIEPVLYELIEKNEKYRLVPTIILDKYEILSNRELDKRDQLLEKMLEQTQRMLNQAEEISATKQILLDDKDKLIDILEAEIAELRARLKNIPPTQDA